MSTNFFVDNSIWRQYNYSGFTFIQYKIIINGKKETEREDEEEVAFA